MEKWWDFMGCNWVFFMRIEWEHVDECQLLKLVPSYDSNHQNGDSLSVFTTIVT